MSKAGRPKHKVTEDNQELVKSLSAVGIKYEDIASRLSISSDTLVKYYKSELDEGRIDANARIGKSLYDSAREGNTAAQIFWLKTRAGWKETDRHELVGADGSPMEMIVKWAEE